MIKIEKKFLFHQNLNYYKISINFNVVNEMLFNVMKPDQTEDEKTADDDKVDKNFMKQISSQEKKLTKESKIVLVEINNFLFSRGGGAQK